VMSPNLTMDKATGLVSSLFNSLRGAFWHTEVCTVHSLWTYQCPPLCLLTVKNVNLVVASDGFLL